MLKGLDDIDWASLEHAYGSAEDIPELLRQRASSDPEVAKNAESEFFGNIWHQGTVYEATAPAVPFLVELLASPETVARGGLVLLLASIAEGTSFWEVHQDLAHYAKTAPEPERQSQLAEELEWKRGAREAVSAHAELYWTLLDDPEVKVAIPYLLSKLEREADRLCAEAQQRVGSETDELFAASLLFGWVFSCRVHQQHLTSLVSLLRKSAAPLVRLGGSLGTLRLSEDPADLNEALRAYFDALHQSSKLEPENDCWFWGEGDLRGMLLQAIPHFGSRAKDALLNWLPSILPLLEDHTASSLASEAIGLVFDGSHFPKSKTELTSLQFELLRALTRVTNVHHSDPLIVGIQQALGLPNDMKRLKAYLDTR